ncbi:unnamed protein product [Bursaphelenchus okinawaensis]|uniref:Uncharacterized protein n=1 Tax=Bursaphelenchus okinawaensis TaxID=465554 RepID=A0A811KC30_9BILA|nr:unnamed protein product [Bursaphelenchus okinawaensis]CAG9097590.1 unnamed protein product [Bursaphelenchus okinawaensis]
MCFSDNPQFVNASYDVIIGCNGLIHFKSLLFDWEVHHATIGSERVRLMSPKELIYQPVPNWLIEPPVRAPTDKSTRSGFCAYSSKRSQPLEKAGDNPRQEGRPSGRIQKAWMPLYRHRSLQIGSRPNLILIFCKPIRQPRQFSSPDIPSTSTSAGPVSQYSRSKTPWNHSLAVDSYAVTSKTTALARSVKALLSLPDSGYVIIASQTNDSVANIVQALQRQNLHTTKILTLTIRPTYQPDKVLVQHGQKNVLTSQAAVDYGPYKPRRNLDYCNSPKSAPTRSPDGAKAILKTMKRQFQEKLLPESWVRTDDGNYERFFGEQLRQQFGLRRCTYLNPNPPIRQPEPRAERKN